MKLQISGIKSPEDNKTDGMSSMKLAATLSISEFKAQQLIDEYFDTFPNIEDALNNFADFGTKHGYIMTPPPFKRKRWFPEWQLMNERGRDSNKIKGSIERRSKNTPIQGASADMTKLAKVYVRDYIKKHRVPVEMVMVVHDQIDTVYNKKEFPEWPRIFSKLMEKAGKKIVKNGLLRSETETSPVWKK